MSREQQRISVAKPDASQTVTGRRKKIFGAGTDHTGNGNRLTAMTRRTPGATSFFSSPFFNVTRPDDPFEDEASRIADEIVSPADVVPHLPIRPIPASSPTRPNVAMAIVQPKLRLNRPESRVPETPTERKEAEEQQEESLMPGFDLTKSSGRALPREWRSYFEPRLGANLGGVRIHADGAAAQMARGINALAFTVGQDVYYGAAGPDFASTEGRRLMAHELVHTVQQGGAQQAVQRQPDGGGKSDSSGSEEASYHITVYFQKDEENTHLIQALSQVFFVSHEQAWMITFALPWVAWVDPESMESLPDGKHSISIPVVSYDAILKYLGRSGEGSKGGSIYGEEVGEPEPDKNWNPESSVDCVALAERLKKLDVFPEIKKGDDSVDDVVEKHAKELPTKTGFRNEEDYQTTKKDFVRAFKATSRQYAFDMLAQSRKVILAEQARYQNMAEIETMARDLGTVAPLYGMANEEEVAIGREADARDQVMPPGLDSDLVERYGDVQEAKAEIRSGLADRYPILADPRLNIPSLTVLSPGELQKKLLDHAKLCLDDSQTTEANLSTDLDFVMDLDELYEESKRRLGLKTDSAPTRILDAIRTHNKRVDTAITIATGVITLALALSGFVLIPALITVGSAAYGYVRGTKEKAAAGTSFDPALSLSSNDPNLYWLAADIVGAILDIAPAIKATKLLKTAGVTFFALKRDAQIAMEAKEAIESLKNLALKEGRMLGRVLGLKGIAIESFASRLAKVITASAESGEVVARRVETAMEAMKDAPETIRAIQMAAPGLRKESLAGITHFDQETQEAIAKFAGDTPGALDPSMVRRLRISGRRMAARRDLLDKVGMMAHASPEFVDGLQILRKGMAGRSQMFDAMLEYFGSTGYQTMNLMRAVKQVGMKSEDITAILTTLEKRVAGTNTIQESLIPALLKEIGTRIGTGKAGRDMLFEITDLLNPSQSGSIFETWMKTNFHQSGFGRKQLQVVEGSTTVTIYPDNILKNPSGISIADYKHLRAEGAFGAREVQQLRRYRKLLASRPVIEGVPKSTITRVEYFFSTENAARVNLAAIQRTFEKGATVYYVDTNGLLVKLFSN